MFQSCFKASGAAVQDPVNSLSELVIEHWLGLDDGMETDEHGNAASKLKSGFQLHWHVPSFFTHQLVSFQGHKITSTYKPFIYLNFSGDVIIPPPDGYTLVALLANSSIH